MTEPNTLLVPVAGFLPDYGPFTTAPQGALADAKNVQLRVPGVIEPRGPFEYGYDSSESLATKLYSYGVFTTIDDALTAHIFNVATDGLDTIGVLRRNADTTVTALPGESPTEFAPGGVHHEHAGGRDYFTSEQGVYALNTPSTTARVAGMPRPMAGYAYANLFGSWLPVNTVTGYRFVNVKKTPEGDVYSPPSSQVIAGYTTGSSFRQVEVSVVVDTTALVAGDEIQVYRSVISVPGPDSLPSDEMRLRYTHTLTSADLLAGQVTFMDDKADNEWSGPALYTNATQQGIEQASWRPGFAQDIAFYNGMMFYGGMKSRQRLSVTLNTVQVGTTHLEQVWGSFLYAGTITAGSNVITGISAADIAGIFVGQYVDVGYSAGPPFLSGTTVVAVGATSITVSTNALFNDSVFTVSDWIAVDEGSGPQILIAARTPFATNQVSVVRLDYYIPQASRFEVAYAQAYPTSRVRLYADGTNSTDPRLGIQFLFERIYVNDPDFIVTSNKPLAFDKYLDTVGIYSKIDYAPSQYAGSAYLFYSKEQEPEAVPLGNFAIVGDEKFPISRVIATKAALWVFKTDGLWRVTGDDPSSLRIDQFDPTLQMNPNDRVWSNLVVKFDNDVYAWTTKGIYRISDGGATPIDTGIRQFILSKQYDSDLFNSYTYSTASQVDRWILFCPRYDVDPARQLMYVYWPDTNNWTYWTFLEGVPNYTTAAGNAAFLIQGYFIPFAGGNRYPTYSWDASAIGPDSTGANQLCADSLPGSDGVTISIVDGVMGTNSGTYGLTTPRVGDAIRQADIDLVDQVYYVTGVAGLVITVDRPGLVAGPCTWHSAFTTRVLWAATPGAGLGRNTYFQKMTYAFDAVRGGQFFDFLSQGYQNATVVTDRQRYFTRGATNDVQPQDGSYGLPSGIPTVLQPVVPKTGPRRDWGIRAGFTTTTAGLYFKINGCALHWSPIDSKITR